MALKLDTPLGMATTVAGYYQLDVNNDRDNPRTGLRAGASFFNDIFSCPLIPKNRMNRIGHVVFEVTNCTLYHYYCS
jgi:hypothetical protein